jgi:hypothetical protein
MTSSPSPAPLVLGTPPPVPGSYICNNISYPTYHGYDSIMKWQFPYTKTSLSKTVLCSAQAKPCTGHYELTTWSPIYPRTAPNNPVANQGSPGQDVLQYVDMRCVDDDAATPANKRFSIVPGPLPELASDTPLKATDQEVCVRFAGSPLMNKWVNQEKCFGPCGPYQGLSMWNSIQSGMPLIKCTVNTKPEATVSEINACVSGLATMPPPSPSVSSPPLEKPKPPFQVKCSAIPYNYEFDLVTSTLSDDPAQNVVTNASEANWQKVASFKQGTMTASSTESWDCIPDKRTTTNGVSNDVGTTYTCTGYTGNINSLFMTRASDKISCDKPDFAKCVSTLYNNFQHTFIPPFNLPPTYSGTCSSVAATDCSAHATENSCDDTGCTWTQQCSDPTHTVQSRCEAGGATWSGVCLNDKTCGDADNTSCLVDSDCPGTKISPGTPAPQMGSTCAGMPAFTQLATDENVWVPSQWPSMASPLPQVLEGNNNGASCSAGALTLSGQDLATMVQYVCSSTQLGQSGQLMKYVTVYDKDMTEIINQALYASLNSGCQQFCDKTGKCSEDGLPCKLDTDCMGHLSEVFVPETTGGTCSAGSCSGGPMQNYPCTLNSDCAGDMVDVRTTGRVYQDRCTSAGGTWQWYVDMPPPGVTDTQRTYQGAGIDPTQFVAYLPQESLSWKSGDPPTEIKGMGSTISKNAGRCNMYVLEQQGQATPGCYAQGVCTKPDNCSWHEVLTGTSGCVVDCPADSPQYLEGAMFTPPINTQSAACPPFCDLESSLMTIGTVAAGAAAAALVPGVGGLVAGALIAGGAVGGGAMASKIQAAMGGIDPDDPVADPQPPIESVCGSALSEMPVCVTGPKVVLYNSTPDEVGCEGTLQKIQWQDQGSYKGSLQCLAESDIWTCATSELPDQSDPNKPVGEVINCRRIVDGVEKVAELNPDNLQQAGTQLGKTGYINRTTYMNANYMNAQVYQFVHNEAAATKPPAGVIPNYSFPGFARDYLHWLYG